MSSAGRMTRQKANSLMGRAMDLIDQVMPPETRRELTNNCYSLANDRPFLATPSPLQTFLAIQILLSALPLLLFVSFTLATIVLAVVAALAFCIFWIVAALLILIPTLFAAVSAGLFIWIWAVGTYVFGRFAYRSVYPRLQQSAAAGRKTLQGAATTTSNSIGNAARRSAVAANNYSNGSMSSSSTNTAPGVPDLVKRSFNQAHESPEAAGNEEAVEEKKALEHELLDGFGQQGRDYSRSNGQLSNDNVTQKADGDGDYSKVEIPGQQPSRYMPGANKF
ncbi:MAG: hypothetical protein M1816_001086 [Peltula sp. TS41687]|nr:MAG: hypothetical protein M1816_001086 [Peltula sp. TS41687]